MTRIDEIKERVGKAPRGLWYWEKARTMSHLHNGDNFLGVSMHHEDEEDVAIAALIEHASTDIPWLVERHEKMLEALRGLMIAYGATDGRNGNSGECWDDARAAIALTEQP